MLSMRGAKLAVLTKVFCLCLVAGEAAAETYYKGEITSLPTGHAVRPLPGWTMDCQMTQSGSDGSSHAATKSVFLDSNDGDVVQKLSGNMSNIFFNATAIIGKDGRVSVSELELNAPGVADNKKDEASNLINYFMQSLPVYGVALSQDQLYYSDQQVNDVFSNLVKLIPGAELDNIRNEMYVRGLSFEKGEKFIIVDGSLGVGIFVGTKYLSVSSSGYYMIHVESGHIWQRYNEEKIKTPQGTYKSVKVSDCTFSGTAVGSKSVEQRLSQVDNLLKQGLISSEEAAAKRQEILSGM